VDSEIAALASTGAATIVTLMTTDAWGQVKKRVAALFRAGKTDHSKSVAGQLESSRIEVISARSDSAVITEAEAEWSLRLQRLLAAEPAVIPELMDIIQAFGPKSSSVLPQVTMKARATGHGQIYQAGRDQHFGER
jgi:hypothetical protein